MKFSHLWAFSMLILIGCQSDSEEISFEELPVFTPNIIQEFESLGEEIFFSHLGYKSSQLDDGSVFLPDRDLSKIFKVSSDGTLISTIASEGRGPGEIQDITFVSRSYDYSLLVRVYRLKR